MKGEILELKATINTMVDQLSSFAAEVTRVAREVGTEGRLGGQAQVRGVSGTWKDLTDNVNFMAGNLTGQVRGIAKVVTAVANGDLKQKLTVEAKGEIAALAETINSMTDTLATFADQVTTVAREVGVEGKLGGQAKVPGAAGTWKGLTENVNELAANLTTQVRAIAEVATAVTQGDLTRSITVETQGEVAALKDTINEMIRNLKDTTQKNTEQDWLKTNLAKFSRMLQGQKDLVTVGQLILSELAPVVGAQQAEFYVLSTRRRRAAAEAVRQLRLGRPDRARQGGRPRRRAWSASARSTSSKILLTNVPSHGVPHRLGPERERGAGRAGAAGRLRGPGARRARAGVAASASTRSHQAFLDQLTESIGIVINTIEANIAHRGPADAVAVARRGAAEPPAGAAADQRGAAGEGAAAGAPEPGGRAQEPGGRAGAPGARGEGRAARADLEVQVRVPGQHVARAAHAAEQPADPVGPAVQEPRRQPDAASRSSSRRRSTRRATTC